jgi:hypothetical protein
VVVPSTLGEVNNDVSTLAASSAPVVLVVLLVGSWFAAGRMERGTRLPHRSRGLWFAALASIALIVSVTLFRNGISTGFDLSSLAEWSTDGARRLWRDPFGSSQFVLNIVLFVPAGIAVTLLWRRPGPVWGSLVGLSVLVEALQAITGAGANDVADLVANSAGAAIGVAVAATVVRVADGRDLGSSRRARRFTIAAAIACCVAAVAGLFVGASVRQQRVEDRLRATFEGTVRSDIESMMADDSEAVFVAGGDRSNGTRNAADTIEIRYPATFLGLDRCVVVIWRDAGVEFERTSGRRCTEFMG